MTAAQWLRPTAWSLATRVAVAAGAFLAILLAIVLVTYGRANDERRQAEIENAIAEGQTVAGLIDSFAQDLETTTLAMAVSLGQSDIPLDQEHDGPYLNLLSNSYGMLRGLFVIDPAGKVLAAASGEGIGIDLSTRPYFTELQRGVEKVWGPGVTGIQSGDVTLTFARPIRGADDVLDGYLVAAFYPPRLAERLQGRIPPDSDVTLVDRTGFILHSNQRPNLTDAERDVSRSPRVLAALSGEVVPVEGPTQFYGGADRYGVVVRVPTTGWAVAFTRPTEPLEEKLRGNFRQQAGEVTVVVLLVGTLLALATSRIVRPLAEFGAAASAVARGERPHLPPMEGTPELGQLADAMNRMAEAVANREDALRRQAATLEQTIRARDDFLALVSHDLKNPLAAIRNTASLMRRQIGQGREPDSASILRAADIIDRATMRAVAQIDQLLDIARLQSGERLDLSRKPTDLVALTRSVVATEQEAVESHKLVLNTPENPIVGNWDAARLERALVNLLSNAVKYSPGGGTVTVTVRQESEATAAISVGDHGLGIPRDALAKIFDRFYRAENVAASIPGTGLGLAAVRFVVEEHGGTIHVESEPGSGSTFTLRLPLSGPAS